MSMSPDDPLAEAIIDAFPLDDITVWSTEQLHELAVWNAAVLAADPLCPEVIELTDEPPHVELPEHSVTPEDELDNPYDGSL